MYIEVTVSEIFDKLSILEIKKQHGLNVNAEYESLYSKYYEIITNNNVLAYYYSILKVINEQMWLIEDRKRQHELEKKFDETFINLSRSIYMINDERARIKKIIDTISNSKLKEQKLHREYLK